MTTPIDEHLIPVRVVVGKKTICQKAKLFEESATVKTIIDEVLAAAAERADGNITFSSVEACASAEALDRDGTELDNDDLATLTVKQLRGCFGGFDDKCKVPYGAPGEYVSATTRDHAGGGARGSLAPEKSTLGALDHDHYKVLWRQKGVYRGAGGAAAGGCADPRGGH